MVRTLIIGVVSTAVLTLSGAVFAQQQSGTAQEARALLDRAVTAVTADRAVALAMFNNGEGGFKDRDLYPFCFNLSDGKFVAAIKARAIGSKGHCSRSPSRKPCKTL